MSTVAAAPSLTDCPHCGDHHAEHILRCPNTDLELPLPGRVLAGKFRFQRSLGKGGMAEVWSAINLDVDRTVAIKLLRRDVVRSEDIVARFRGEAKAAGRIGHPNVCDILDYGLGPLGPYIVMERLEGFNLGELLRRRGHLPVGETVAIVRQALQGLAAVHARGIVHRDLKPENIFLHRTADGRRVVKLTDFGIAKLTDGTAEYRTEHGALLGTPEFMAPEQFRGADHAEPRTDIWAIGAILYKALTGADAFAGPTIPATLLKVAQETPKPLRAFQPEIPGRLEAVVLRCLSKPVQDRFPDVGSLDAHLAPFDGGEPSVEGWSSGVRDHADDEEPGPPTHRDPHESASTPPTPSSDVSATRWQGGDRRSALDARAWLLIGVVAAGLAAGAIVLVRGSADDEPTAVAVAPEPAEVLEPEPTPTPAEPEPPPEPVDEVDEVVVATPDVAAAEPTPDIALAPDVGAAEPEPPSADSDPAADDTGTAPDEPVAPDPSNVPAGVVRVGPFVALAEPGPRLSHDRARNYCAALAAKQHLGVSGWTLPNPSMGKRMADVDAIVDDVYWTSARWRGKVVVVRVPGGKTWSQRAGKALPRVMCVATWP